MVHSKKNSTKMNWFKKIRIDLQRWNFRRKFNSGAKIDIEKQTKAIQKAEELSEKRKCRLWVVRILPGKYKICTKADLKAILRSIGMTQKVNIYQLGEYIVHITKKTL